MPVVAEGEVRVHPDAVRYLILAVVYKYLLSHPTDDIRELNQVDDVKHVFLLCFEHIRPQPHLTDDLP